MDKLLKREIVMPVICSIVFAAFVLEFAQCITEGLIGGIPEEEAEDESND